MGGNFPVTAVSDIWLADLEALRKTCKPRRIEKKVTFVNATVIKSFQIISLWLYEHRFFTSSQFLSKRGCYAFLLFSAQVKKFLWPLGINSPYGKTKNSLFILMTSYYNWKQTFAPPQNLEISMCMKAKFACGLLSLILTFPSVSCFEPWNNLYHNDVTRAFLLNVIFSRTEDIYNIL